MLEYFDLEYAVRGSHRYLDLEKYSRFGSPLLVQTAESTCDSILESLAKDFKREDIINTANLLKKKKIPVTWFIMLGAMAETRETVLETMNTIGGVASKWDMRLNKIKIYCFSYRANQKAQESDTR